MIIIYGIISIICFVGITIFSKKHQNKRIVFFWWACFIIAFLFNIRAIYNNYKSDRQIETLQSEINIFKNKESQKKYKPFSNKITSNVIGSLKKLLEKYPILKTKFSIMCVNPSKDKYQKARELVELFKNAGINADYSNTVMSANVNVFLLYPPNMSKKYLDELSTILSIIFKINQVPVKENDKNRFILYFLGTPYFDEEGRVFF